jgi:DNA-binding IclR family transcriptional regulator
VLAAGLVRRTPRTVVAPGLLRQELDRVRACGVAEEHEESTVGIACTAAPVMDASGRAVAAISITGWATGWTPLGWPAVRRRRSGCPGAAQRH